MPRHHQADGSRELLVKAYARWWKQSNVFTYRSVSKRELETVAVADGLDHVLNDNVAEIQAKDLERQFGALPRALELPPAVGDLERVHAIGCPKLVWSWSGNDASMEKVSISSRQVGNGSVESRLERINLMEER